MENSHQQSRFFHPGKGDAVIDHGTFVWSVDGQSLAREHFAMIRPRPAGAFKRKKPDLILISLTRLADGALDVESRLACDQDLNPICLDSHARKAGRAQPWQANFTFNPPFARLAVGPVGRAATMKLGYDTGCLVSIAPSVLPLSAMIGRIDMKKGGAQSFHFLHYSALDEQLDLTKTALHLNHIDRIKINTADGPQQTLNYFLGTETLMARPNGGARTPLRDIHLWYDDRQRLRKVVLVTGGSTVTVLRQGDEAISAKLAARHG